MIDAHLHLGKDYVYDNRDTSISDILAALESNKLDGAVLYPGNSNVGTETERETHDVVCHAFEEYPNRFWGICQINPHVPEDEYFLESRRYIDLGFKGIAVNPQIYGWDPLSSKGDLIFRTALELDVPLFIYTGIGAPLGLPIKLFQPSKKYPDVKKVLVHAGYSMYTSQYELVMQECKNIYFETSMGTNMRVLLKFIKKYGADKIVMGSELLDEIPHSIYMYEQAGLSDSELKQCTHASILNILGIKEEMQ